MATARKEPLSPPGTGQHVRGPVGLAYQQKHTRDTTSKSPVSTKHCYYVVTFPNAEETYSSVSEAVSRYPEAIGVAIVVSNDYQNSRLVPLAGSHTDSKVMSEALLQLKFAVVCRHNVRKRDLVILIRDVTNDVKYPPSYRRVIFAFSGHGTRDNFLYTQDGDMVCINELLETFKTPRLVDIPKLFFIDACRGDKTDPGVPVARGKGKTSSPKGGTGLKLERLPSCGNFLVAYSTIADYKSFEMGVKGGIWMTALAEKLLTEDKSILDILTKVNQEFTENYQQSWETCRSVQQPELVATLNEVVNLCREAREGRPITNSMI